MATTDSTPKQLPLAIDDAVFEIPMHGGIATYVDAVDADLAAFRWSVSTRRGRSYATRTNYSIHKTECLHRVILARKVGRKLEKGEFVDHIDNNPLNNRRSNLRLSTNKENVRNCAISKNNTSGFKGVFRTPKGRWFAQIMVDRKSRYLGTFDTPEEAHEAYKKAAVEHFGEFARFE